MFKNFSFTHFLILISFIFTILLYIDPNIGLFGLNHYFFDKGEYHFYIIQLFTSSFIHGDIMHFMFNTIFLYIFGTQVEMILGLKKYIYFFVFVTIFNGVIITGFGDIYTNTIGISGFAMAILSYFVLELRSKNIADYKGGITAIIINVLIGFIPGISLLGHLFGVIAGIIFYYINKQFLRPKMVGRIGI